MHNFTSHILTIKQSHVLCLFLILQMLVPAANARAQYAECDRCMPKIALKTNLLHDALLTPDLGIEVSLGQRWSASLEGVFAWWSNDASHRYWRIYGGWAEFRFWPGEKPVERALTGHHIGFYASLLTFDFEFGDKGWQSPDFTYGTGISYGYSWALNRRLNIDVSARVGYSTGKLIKYHPQCDTYVCLKHATHRYLGLTGIEVTLVWFPGRGHKNIPDRTI